MSAHIPFNENHQEMREAVLVLPPKYRLPIYLYYYEGYSVSEIANLLYRKPSKVQTHLARGREKLKQILKEDFDYEKLDLYKETLFLLQPKEETKEAIYSIPLSEHKKTRGIGWRISYVAAVLLFVTIVGFGSFAAVSHMSIQECFQSAWNRLGYTPSTNLQNEFALSQSLEQSCTESGVTVDSMTAANGYVWLLLEATGQEFSTDSQYIFQKANFYDSNDENSDSDMTIQYLGVSEEGVL